MRTHRRGTVRHAGPGHVRVTIELSAVDKPGFWERYGYHNDADWQEQRYDGF
jgi:DMSO/TMAO reductase YedYZ molybdopterin-dependent catalytic subunit